MDEYLEDEQYLDAEEAALTRQLYREAMESRPLTVVRTSSGWTGTRNRQGRCEDAPCCGCCTF